MLNITYRGKFENEKQLIDNDKIPQKTIQFKEGKEINDIFNLGFALVLPIIIPIIIITIIRIQNIEGHINFDLKTGCIIAIAILMNYILKFIHEYIHSCLYPIKSKKTIWKYTSNGAYLIYCNAKISKIRFIVISLAPMIILGITAFILWLFIADKIDLIISLVYVFLTWIMTFFAMGDLVNVYNTIKQVPKNAKVFNYGLHSYWYLENKS